MLLFSRITILNLIFQLNKTVLYIQEKRQKDIFPLCPSDDLYTAISPVSLGYKSQCHKETRIYWACDTAYQNVR